MRSIQVTLFTCLLISFSFMAKGNEKIDKPILASSLKDLSSAFTLSVQKQWPQTIEINPSLPGFFEDPFCQEEDKNPNISYCRNILPGVEEQYIECLSQSTLKGHKRSPFELADILRREAGTLRFRIEHGVKITTELDCESPPDILERVKENLTAIISSEDLYQRIKFVAKTTIDKDIIIYKDNHAEFVSIIKQKIDEQYRLATELVRMSAERGYCFAQHHAAFEYEEEDISKAKEYWALAVAQNCGLSQYCLGLQLEKEGDIKSAETLYTCAAENGHLEAWVKVALFKEREGKLEEAKYLYALVFKERHIISALFYLGLLLEKEGHLDEAEILYAQAFMSRHPSAVFKLRNMKQEGKLTQTKGWFTLTSEDMGDANYALGLLADEQCKEKMADEHYMRAAEEGHPEAIVIMGLRNEGPLQNREEACKLYTRAHENGYIPGSYSLAQLKSTEGQHEEANVLFELAKVNGYPPERGRIEDIVNKILSLDNENS